MDDLTYRFEGIYDDRTLDCLCNLGIHHFSFDFRPTSMNFLPQHAFLDMVSRIHTSKMHYDLHFENEVDFGIQKMLDDLSEKIGGRAVLETQVTLEFSDQLPLEIYEKFKVPFWWHYSMHPDASRIISSPLCKGLILDQVLVEKVHAQGSLFSFIQSLMQLLYQNHHSHAKALLLRVDWDFNPMPFLFDQLDIEYISLPINPQIEVCYRNVDLGRLKNNYQGIGVQVDRVLSSKVGK